LPKAPDQVIGGGVDVHFSLPGGGGELEQRHQVGYDDQLSRRDLEDARRYGSQNSSSAWRPNSSANSSVSSFAPTNAQRLRLAANMGPNDSKTMRSKNLSTCPTLYTADTPDGIVARLRQEASMARLGLKRARRANRRENRAARDGGYPETKFREPFSSAHRRLYAQVGVWVVRWVGVVVTLKIYI
jgi:hypothetical protein